MKKRRASKLLPLSREVLNSRLPDSVWSLTDWFWCICRFIRGTVQIEVITLSWAKQTLLRDWFIFSCSEGRFKVSFEEKQLSPHGLFSAIFARAILSPFISLLLYFYPCLLEVRRTFQRGYEFLLLPGFTDPRVVSVQNLCVMFKKKLSRLLMTFSQSEMLLKSYPGICI